MQKIKLINLKKLPKASTLVCLEADNVLREAAEALAKSKAFFTQAGMEYESIAPLLANTARSDEEVQQLSQWTTELTNELKQAKAEKKKEMRQAERLLAPKKKQPHNSNRQRCTRIF